MRSAPVTFGYSTASSGQLRRGQQIQNTQLGSEGRQRRQSRCLASTAASTKRAEKLLTSQKALKQMWLASIELQLSSWLGSQFMNFSHALWNTSVYSRCVTQPSDKASYFKTNLFAVDNMMVYYTDSIAPKIFKWVYSYREPNYLLLILRREFCRSLLTNRICFLKWLLLQTAATCVKVPDLYTCLWSTGQDSVFRLISTSRTATS